MIEAPGGGGGGGNLTPWSRGDRKPLLQRRWGLLIPWILTHLASCETEKPAGGEPAAWFTEITAAAGLVEQPPIWPDGSYRVPEISPAGVALFDYDGDGDLDIYQLRYPPPGKFSEPAPNRLFRNDSGRFVEVPEAAGLNHPGYAHGVAVGDIDNDDDLDVFIANFGPDALYRNGRSPSGEVRFRDITQEAGVGDPRWSSCAAFLDYDRDGRLDLYVSRYLEDDPSRICFPREGEPRDYCGPLRYQAVPDSLYRNRGDGTFEDRSRAAGLTGALPGFAAAAADFTGDGWVDIFVANDMQPNQLYVNRGDGTFAEEGLERGVAVNGAGQNEASMGVAVGDVNGDLIPDLFLTHLAKQTNTLYLSAREPGGRVVFRDRSASSGLGAPSLPMTAWGCGFADFDHDGDLDLAVANGRIARGPLLAGAEGGLFWSRYAEPDQLFINDGRSRFTSAPLLGGAFTAHVEVSHGLAFGDLDGDGDIDMVESQLGLGLRVFRNDAQKSGRHWLKVRALSGRRDALGALVVLTAGGRRQARPIISAPSYASAGDAAAHFGLGGADRADSLEVWWPSGKRESFQVDGVDRECIVVEGKGR